jgi:hypothetical protein
MPMKEKVLNKLKWAGEAEFEFHLSAKISDKSL